MAFGAIHYSDYARAIGAFIAKGFVFDVLIFGPKKPDFPTYRFLCKMSDKMSELVPSMFPDGAICIGQDLPDLVNLSMAGQFSAHILISLVAGFDNRLSLFDLGSLEVYKPRPKLIGAQARSGVCCSHHVLIS